MENVARWYLPAATKHFDALYAGGQFMSSRKAAELLGISKSLGHIYMRWFRDNLREIILVKEELEPKSITAPQEIKTNTPDNAWVDEKSGTVFTDLGQDYGIISFTQGEFRSIRRDYSKHYGGKALTRQELAIRYNFPSIHAFEIFARIHELRQNAIPFTDEELGSEGVDSLVDKAIESRRQEFMLKLSAKEREQEKRDAEKWRAFEVNARIIASELRGVAVEPLPIISGRTGESYALFISYADLHYGKYASDNQGRVLYNRAEAARRMRGSLTNLLEQALKMGTPERIILLAGGSDFLTADTISMKTTRLTDQGAQSEGTYREMLTGAVALMIEAVKTCRLIAPVTLVEVPGNHDAQSSIFMSMLLAQAFEGDKQVNMLLGEGGRALLNYGSNSLFFLHGDNLKRETDLFRLMQYHADAQRQRLQPHKLSFSGHTHGEYTKDLGGIKHHVCSALCAPDAWHAEQGYVGNTEEAQAFLIRRSGGKLATLYSNPELVSNMPAHFL